ncbi:cytochrome b/b6 domain-containing protein [Paracoccus salsus]|uniref:cytochrome b/b6 domain-containing protein n=1 Tax=Paracoccus salsus TaxID=2911061 RepID=UPI001F382F76|nr:cytochrome b/b6 domain-containing protein [Paracoccus salsus]MCF3973626.1 cytochrome b/b6 domain-containing protein [Paracoccus salsus]
MSPVREARRARVWDPALRAFHWILAALVIANWLLGQFGPNVMTLHFWLGYSIAGLLLFRIVWGLVGPAPARFVSFIRGPRAILDYMRHLGKREPSLWPGHNPLGALSVVAMLLALIWQVGTGLISDPEDFINVGPLADQVSSATARKAVGWHHLGGSIILILVLLHVAVILYYRFWKNEDLVRPMITGWKWVRRR